MTGERRFKDFQVIITCGIDGDLVDFDISGYIDKYRLHGGPEQPIRYIVVECSKLKIENIKGTISGQPTDYTLADNIVQGQSKLVIKGVGMGTFIITKIMLESYNYEITAYGVEVLLNSTMLTTSVIKEIMNDVTATELVGTTSWIAKKLVEYWQDNIVNNDSAFAIEYHIFLSSSFDTTAPDNTYDTTGTMVAFTAGMSFLSIINVCALIDNAFMFFGDMYYAGVPQGDYKDTFYFVRYDDSLPIASNPSSKYNIDGFRKGADMDGVLNIYPGLDDPYEVYSETDLLMYENVVTLASQTSEGSDTIVNSQTIQIQDSNGNIQYIVNDDASMPGGVVEYTGASQSMTMYGEYANDVMALERMRGVWVDPDTGYIDRTTPSKNTHYNIEDTAKAIANNMVRRYRDSSQSLQVMMGETTSLPVTENGHTVEYSAWKPTFVQYAHAKYINDDVNNIHLSYYHKCDKAFFDDNPSYTNMSIDNSLLRLSTFVYCYPEMATQYRFGVSKQADLTQTLASLTHSKA